MPQDWNVFVSWGSLGALAIVILFPLALYLSMRFIGVAPTGEPQHPPCMLRKLGGILAGVALVFVYCPMLFFTLCWLTSSCASGLVECRMRQEGRLTDTGVVRDQVIRNTFSEGGVAPPCYWLLIEFRDQEGQLQHVEREVDERSWNQFGPGSRLPDIEYLPSNPTTWRFAAEAGLWLRLLFRGCWLPAVLLGTRLLVRACSQRPGFAT
jgi:hypothetical protein